MQRPTENPYARPSAYGRLPQKAFRIGSLPKTVAEPPRSFAAGGVVTGSAIPGPPVRTPEDRQIKAAPPEAPAAADVGDLAIVAPAPAASRVPAAPRESPRTPFDLRIPLAVGGGLAVVAVAGILLARGGRQPEQPVAPPPPSSLQPEAEVAEPVMQQAQVPAAPEPKTALQARPARRQAAVQPTPSVAAPPTVDVVEPAPLTIPTPALAPPPVASPPPDPEAAMSTSAGG